MQKHPIRQLFQLAGAGNRAALCCSALPQAVACRRRIVLAGAAALVSGRDQAPGASQPRGEPALPQRAAGAAGEAHAAARPP
jgi:hypothetical protein